MTITADDLAKSVILGALPDDARTALAARARKQIYGTGTRIVVEGDEGDTMHLLRRGVAKAVHVENGQEVRLRNIPPGEVFGELAVLDPAPRSASVVAVSECETIEVGRDDLDQVFAEFPDAPRLMLGAMARSLTYAREEVQTYSLHLEDKVRERTQEVRETQLEIVRRLGQAVEVRDAETGLHIIRMSRYAGKFSEALGLRPVEVELILNAAPMHDIGKIGVPDSILLKPGKLTDEEWTIMRSHTTLGAALLEGSKSALLAEARDIALNHHERWDGGGYPNGISGEDIPLSARICSISDVFDALTTERPYKKAWSVDEAVDEIDKQRGKLFDPTLVDVFHEVLPDLLVLREVEAA